MAPLVQNPVLGIAPPLIPVVVGPLTLILLEAVRVQVAEPVHPVEAAPGRALQRPQSGRIAQPAPQASQQEQEQRGGVGRAVIRGVRHGTEAGPLAAPQLVRDLPRLGVPERIQFSGLELAQTSQGRQRQAVVDDQGLVGGQQRVPAEQGYKPGQARRRHPQVGAQVEFVQAQ